MWFREVNVPGELVEAARAGQLVLFIGAGASRDAPASLPDFRQLVIDVGTRARSVPSAADCNQPDVFLGRLADQGVDVHGLVARALDKSGTGPNRLHRAVIDLARVHPPLRIVTTNYDPYLTVAAQEAGVTVDVFRAPALPVGDDFAGLVHLHGALDQEKRRLIVTDADFGRAYLREAWAARFLERMFSAFTVLFIGYSHGDVVMQYLARSLGSGNGRFVLTDQGDSPDWKRLGLTPIEYPVEDGSHAALAEALERWAGLTAWGRLDHRRQIASMIGAGPPTIQEEVSYLDEVLGDAERVRYFVEEARGPVWLAWVAERPEFNSLFLQPGLSQRENAAVTRAITQWVVDNFVMLEAESPPALRLMRDKAWTAATWSTIAHRLVAQNARMPDWQVPWLVLTLHQAPPGRNEMLDMLLCKESWQERPELARMLFEHRTRPMPASSLDFGEITDHPMFEVEIVGDEHWLTRAWTNVFTPMLDTSAPSLLDLAVHQLRTAYGVASSLRPGFDALTFGRSAIEPHPQDAMRKSVDVLIDAARDCLERLLILDPPTAARHIDDWARAPEAILRRMAVHGWRLRTDRDADTKIAWICDENLLYDLELQHEVFQLLKDTICLVNSDRVAALLTKVAEGPRPTNGRRESLYRRYNILAWLERVAPESQLIADAFRQAQTAHPEFTPREHPDLNMYMTSGWVEDTEPFTTEEMHAMIQADPAEALARMRAYQANDEFSLTGPTWAGALKAVRACVTKHAHDGLRLNDVLTQEDNDIRCALIDAWADADLQATLPDDIIATIRAWKTDEIRLSAGRMLAHGGTGRHATAWHRNSSARELAAHLWPEHEVQGNITETDDIHLEAINHPAGDLAKFWTKVVAHDWSHNRDDWKGIPEHIETQLNRMIIDQGRNGLLARSILASHLRFYFGADTAWTRAHLLPLFDWTSAHPQDARAVWQSFLSYGQPDDGLLDAGLLAFYLETLRRSDSLVGEQDATQLAEHLAIIALFASIDPSTWLPTLVTEAPAEVRLAWIHSIARSLRDLTAEESAEQWDRWIHAYWVNRIESVPRPLTGDEASAMAEWVLGVPARRSDAVNLFEQAPASLTKHDRLLHDVADENLEADPIVWTRFLTHVLHGTTEPSWEIGYYLKGTVQRLQAATPAPDTSELIEQAMRLGCTEAGDW